MKVKRGQLQTYSNINKKTTMKKSHIRSRVRTLLENYMEDEKSEMNEDMMSVEELYVSFMMGDEDVQSEARGRISSIFASQVKLLGHGSWGNGELKKMVRGFVFATI